MIQANELRLGNWVYRDKRTEIVSMILPYFSHLQMLDPVPLTEEWLLDFGFKFKDDGETIGKEYVLNDYSVIFYDIDEIMFIICNYMDIPPGVRIEHVHQLQNLYFSLTSTELTTNP